MGKKPNDDPGEKIVPMLFTVQLYTLYETVLPVA
jgi:hypothetical protein